MGIQISSKKKILCEEEIKLLVEKNSSLEIMYNNYKNANGIISQKDFQTMFNGDNFNLPLKIVKKLYKIFSSEKQKMNYDDFVYFYCTFNCENFDAKINFVAEIIFGKNVQISYEKYKQKIKLYFYDYYPLYYILCKDDFVAKVTLSEKIIKENFVKNSEIKEKKFFESFSFLNNKFFNCECVNNKKITKSLTNNNLIKFDKLENEFKNLEKFNNGVFSISFFENILNEIEINKNWIALIVSYFKKKTQKSFIDFQNFKYFLSKVSNGNNDLISFIFEIISFPKNFINKSDLFVITKSLKPLINSSIYLINF